MGVDLAQGLDVADQLVFGSRERLVCLFLDRQASLKCFNGRLQILHHLQVLGGSLIHRDGRSRSTGRWGVGGGRVAMSLARRPVPSWQFPNCTAPIAAGSSSRRSGTRTKCSDMANALRASRRSQSWCPRHHAHKMMANAPRAKRPYRHLHDVTRQRDSSREHRAARNDEGEGIPCCSTKCGINNVGSITSVLEPTVAKQSVEFDRRGGEEEGPFVEEHPMGSRVVPTTATPGPWWFSTNDGTGRSTFRSQTIVVSASLQRGQASKERKKNNTEVTPQRACHRPSHTVRGFWPLKRAISGNCQLRANISYTHAFRSLRT